MKKLILLTGDLACGKTTYSKILSKRYKTEVYNKDTIKEILGDTIGFSNRADSLKLSHATVAIMTEIFVTKACLEQDLILEANFHKDEVAKLQEIAQDNGYKILILNFYAGEQVLYERFMNRINHEHRHPVHQTAGLESFEAFCEYIAKSRKEIETVEKLDVDANDFSYQCDDKLFAITDDFMEH